MIKKIKDLIHAHAFDRIKINEIKSHEEGKSLLEFNCLEQTYPKEILSKKIESKVIFIDNALEAANIEEATENLKDLEHICHSENEISFLTTINDTKSKNNKRNKEGITDPFGVQYVDYPILQNFQNDIHWTYPHVRYPAFGNIVFPYRRKLIARRGYTEKLFKDQLQIAFTDTDLLIIGDCNILLSDNSRPYEPDIAIICKKHPSIRIDIEIDEPYAAISNKPIHYIGGGDDFRDLNLINLGWIVVRFTENQVYANPKGCIANLAQMLHYINPSLKLSPKILEYPLPEDVDRWSEIEAKLMASERLRENYLDHKFGVIEENPLTQTDIKQSEHEKYCASLVPPIIFKDNQPKTVSDGYTEAFKRRDNDIQFLAYEHIYLYKGKQQFISVSNLISHFFKPYDSLYLSTRKADQRHVPQGQVLEEWDSKSAESKELGTFMHLQIVNLYKGLNYQDTYQFTYSGKYVNVDKVIPITKELHKFQRFRDVHSFIPFRIEWTIYDEDLGIAGTIDMIVNKGNEYDIYDWKRSNKIVDVLGNPILTNPFGSYGINGLESQEDTPYWRYCIQQNLYRYILEKKMI